MLRECAQLLAIHYSLAAVGQMLLATFTLSTYTNVQLLAIHYSLAAVGQMLLATLTLSTYINVVLSQKMSASSGASRSRYSIMPRGSERDLQQWTNASSIMALQHITILALAILHATIILLLLLFSIQLISIRSQRRSISTISFYIG